ncbi:MAG: MFS transporter [Actinomycetota bacterium]
MTNEAGSNPKARLFLMMVLQFFIWGAWLPVLFDYLGGLGFTEGQKALIGSTFAIASIVGIFFSNQFAGRNFSAERFMGASHLIGGLALGGLCFTRDFNTFFVLMLIHALVYVPTISVSNSLAFANLKDPQKEFGIIRMGGTIGWILAAWPLYFILQGQTGEAAARAQSAVFLVAAVASLALAAFSLTLPHTPPKRNAPGESLAWAKAFKLLAVPYIFVLFLVTLVDSTIHNGYFVMAFTFLKKIGVAAEYVTPVMSIGQVAEILTMAALGLVLKRLGWKTTMIVGILGHAARFAVFAFMSESIPVIIAVQVLHGICYAFFFATLYIYIDAVFPKDIRTSAQGLFNLLILGIGDLAAKWLFVPLQAHYTVDGVTNYQALFLVPTGMAVAGAVIMALFFHPPKEAPEAIGQPATAH